MFDFAMPRYRAIVSLFKRPIFGHDLLVIKFMHRALRGLRTASFTWAFVGNDIMSSFVSENVHICVSFMQDTSFYGVVWACVRMCRNCEGRV